MLGIFDSTTGAYKYFTGPSAPSDYNVVPKVGSNMDRSVNYRLTGDFVGRKDQITVSINALPLNDLKDLIRLTIMKFFKVSYWCDYINDYKNSTFYIGNDLNISNLNQWNDPGFDVYKVSFTLTEQ